METIKALFANKLVDDDREPLLTFAPFFDPEHRWALYAPKFELWQQLLLLLLVQTVFQYVFAVVNYYGIVRPRKRLELESQRQSATTKTANAATAASSTLSSAHYLLGWGVVIPICLYFPYVVLETLQIRNKCIKTATGSTLLVVLFRTIEAMYGTSPQKELVESSLSSYMIYYSSIVHFVWDAKTGQRRHITLMQLLRNGISLMISALALSAVLSIEMHYNFQPFSSRVNLQDFSVLDRNLLSWSHLGNMYGLAVLTNLTLVFGLGLSAIGEQVKGLYETQRIFYNPLFTSRSPSDFWGRKWNIMIHTILKHGAYQPTRQLFQSTPLAIIVTFVASGLFHDYVWTLMFYHYASDQCEDNATDALNCYTPARLKLTAFFAWNGVVMILETTSVGRALGRFVSSLHLPTFIVSTLVVLTALPISHWYTGDWVEGRYFAHLSLGMWMLKRV